MEVNNDLSSGKYNYISRTSDLDVQNEKLNGSISESVIERVIFSTPQIHKRKIFTSNEYGCISSSDTETDCIYLNKNKKTRRIKNSPIANSRQNHADLYSAVEQYKKTLEIFFQYDICLKLPLGKNQKIDMCIECRDNQMKKHSIKSFDENYLFICRFCRFRQLKFTKSGILVVAGFPSPKITISSDDLEVWIPTSNLSTLMSNNFDLQASRIILEYTGPEFCKFVNYEKEALKLNLIDTKKKCKVVWKKRVSGVRETCDVCVTSIFNYHWTCNKCGFVVCIDCYKYKFERDKKINTRSSDKGCAKKNWLLCSDQVEHQINCLLMTQITAGDILFQNWNCMHELCELNNIPLNCNCKSALRDSIPLSFVKNEPISQKSIVQKKNVKQHKLINKDKNNGYTHKVKIANMSIIPRLSLIKNESCSQLCDGQMLCLLYTESDDNLNIFQDKWKRGQPVLVRGVGNNLKDSLWNPESFSRDFGRQKSDLINCITGKIIYNKPMRKFWEGFENASARLCDKQGPMLLKLKDWPPSVDFAEKLPSRFEDLMNCLPLKEYTQRNGKFNLAARLPKCFVPPDLGPKMYTAYGNCDSRVGTTNLHLDMTDAVNVMVRVAVTKNCKEYDHDWYVRKAKQIIEEAGCDELTKMRVFINDEIPGALWHIYHASDADKIRDLLIKVRIESGSTLEKCSDPIHDQSFYLDSFLRKRLYKEYGVIGYTIVQCDGDAVFIPAGAPHQVKNLHNCIKVAEDFVSPENIQQSFRMAQEFRNLSDSHSNHEDILQIKNIVYHAIKDSIAVLKYE